MLTLRVVISSCKVVISILGKSESTPTGANLIERAREGRQIRGYASKECWSELQHAISRLLAYPQSIKFMLLAKDKWPMLFRGFEISFIKSSDPVPRPYRNASQSASSIVGRMTRKQKDIETFRNFVGELQYMSLDEAIKKEYKNDRFRPIVHSEVSLHEFLRRSGRLNPDSFFNGWMYIGSSKPTCKLCDYYFKCYEEIHGVHVGYRPSHGNLYLNWRVPDVFATDGTAGTQGREKMVRKILDRARKDAFDIVKKKTPSVWKANDSNTFSVRLSTGKWEGTAVDLDDMASMLGQVDLNEREDSDY